MSENATPNDNEMSAETVTTYTPPSYDIAPEDRAIADEIRNMDLLRDVPSAVSYSPSLKLGPMKATALPPELRRSVEEQLVGVPADQREARESALVAAAIQSVRGTIRRRIGNHPDALPWHQEETTLAIEEEQLDREARRIMEQLTEVDGYQTEYDAAGKPQPKAVWAVQGERRRALETRLKEVDYQLGLLFNKDGSLGPEGQRRMDKALAESVAIRKKRAADIADAAEIKRRVEAKVREDRINETVDAIARSRKGVA